MKLDANPDQADRVTSARTTRATTRRGARIARVIALSGVVGLFACQDTTAPEETDQADLAGPSLVVLQMTPLGMIGATLVDATSWVLPSINDATKRTDMQNTIKSLANNLVTGAYDAARADLAKGIAIRATLDAIDTVEIGPIEVSFSETDTELKAIGK